jgi:hypothetical protein
MKKIQAIKPVDRRTRKQLMQSNGILAESNSRLLAQIKEMNQTSSVMDGQGRGILPPGYSSVLMGAERANKCATEVRMSSPPSPDHSGAVGKLVEELNSGQDITHNIIDELSKKLDPILAPPFPGSSPSGANPVASCGLADVLIGKCVKQRSINERLREILHRIAL